MGQERCIDTIIGTGESSQAEAPKSVTREGTAMQKRAYGVDDADTEMEADAPASSSTEGPSDKASPKKQTGKKKRHVASSEPTQATLFDGQKDKPSSLQSSSDAGIAQTTSESALTRTSAEASLKLTSTPGTGKIKSPSAKPKTTS